MNGLVVVGTLEETVAIQCSPGYELLEPEPGFCVDVLIVDRERQNRSLNHGMVISKQAVDLSGDSTTPAFLCAGDFLLDPETGDPILRVFKP